jgi:hypothetical protein
MDNFMQPVMKIESDGDTVWRLNGKLHRTNGPAIEYAYGRKEWWLNDNRHRTDGPAIEYADGGKEWCLNGVGMSFDEWLSQSPGLTNKQKTFYRLQYA